ADYRVRIFTPRTELPFAGHPSVGSAHAALHAGIVTPRDGALVQQCAAGLLPVRVEHHTSKRTHVYVRAPRACMREISDDERQRLAALLPATSHALLDLCRVADNGPLWMTVPLPDAESVRRWLPDMAAIGELCARSACVGIAVYAGVHAPDHQRVVRAFCPNDGIPEDPVTGSANAAIAAVLHDQDSRLPKRIIASQGRELGRDGFVHVEVDDDAEVWIGGDCVVAVSGTLDWPWKKAPSV
ncbi:MAG: PhzF family phenazine biosynthesis protein, partial [Dokdonella sp.]